MRTVFWNTTLLKRVAAGEPCVSSAPVAELVAHCVTNEKVLGSIPSGLDYLR